MRFTARVPLGILATLAVLASSLVAAEMQGMTKQVVSGTEHQTRLTLSFDEAQTAGAVASWEFSDGIHDHYGALLAIAGQGTPTARVSGVELGDAVRMPSSLDELEIPSDLTDLVQVGEPAILHDLRVVAVNVSPVMADETGMLRFVRSMDVEVATSGSGGVNTKRIPGTFSSAFYPLYRSTIDNLDELYPGRSTRPPGRMIVLGASHLVVNQLEPVPFFQTWVDLKRRKGYTVQVRTLADVHDAVADSSINGIQAYFEAEYHDPAQDDLEYALIVGDVSGVGATVPSPLMQNPEYPGNPEESSVGDNPYLAVDGNDYMPDVFGGRVSATSQTEYIAYFNKVNEYEMNPYLDDRDWFESATIIAGNYADGQFPVTPVWNSNWARESVMRSGLITDADTFYFHDNFDQPGEYTQPISDDIVDGVCAVFYRGWANALQWFRPIWGIPQIRSMELGRRNPAVFGIVCGSGDYSYTGGSCFGEVFLSGTGTPTSQNGAIFYFGASDLHTNTRHNNAMLSGIVRSLEDGVRSSAALGLAGKIEVWEQFPLVREPDDEVHFYGFHVFNLLGDPETQIYFGQPETFSVIHPTPLSPGETLVEVQITNGQQPTPDAVVTLRDAANPEEVSVRMTDAGGRAWLPANLTVGTAQLTVWKAGFFLHRTDIPVNAETGFDPYVVELQWDAGSDNLPNPGEQASFQLVVENRGNTAHQPTITVTAIDTDQIEVIEGNPNTGVIQPGGVVTTSSSLIRVLHEVPDGAHPRLNVAFDNIDREVEVDVAAPHPLIASFNVQGPDGILSPNETAEISVTLLNVGTVDGESVTASVSCFSNAINITSGDLSWPSLPMMALTESSNTFTASVPEDVTPGTQVMLRVFFDMNGVTFTAMARPLTIGEVEIDDPTGPDDYGYYAYEDIDIGYDATPTYQWEELIPDSQGTYDNIYSMYDDTHVGVRLPQPFQFYGQSFDSIWICGNGWISFENATIPEFRNWEIPSPIGPPSMVCPFWDDLISFLDNEDEHNDNLEHHVYTRSIGDQFVIQWQTLNRRGLENATQQNPSTDYCTFEVILEPVANGDGSILCQYKQVANIDGKQNFASVGIQNSDHTDGLGLTYANHYLASVDTLRPGRAIRFTTDPPDGYLDADDPATAVGVPAQFALHPAFPNPFNPSTELRFDIVDSGPVTLRIFDMLGRETAVLIDQTMTAGSYGASFNGTALPSGLYFARLTSGTQAMVQKLMLVK